MAINEQKIEIPGVSNNTVNTGLECAFTKAFANKEMSFQFLDLFPFIVAVFSPDGTLLYLNRAGYEELQITYPNPAIGKYNILKDTVILDKLGNREGIEKAFSGERRVEHNLKFPSDHFLNIKRPFMKVLIQTVSCFPLWDELQQLAYITMVLVTTQVYEGRSEIIKVLEYMNHSWRDEFDRDKLAKVANLSVFHFTRMFKQYQGVTPHDYYKQVKIKHLCEKLLDTNLSITQAFADCGIDIKGRYMQYFKEVVGMTPSAYRKLNLNK
jgi:AraC-like DNA-binding protein